MSELDYERLSELATLAENAAEYNNDWDYGDYVNNWFAVVEAVVNSLDPADLALLAEAIELLTTAYYTETVTVDDFDAIEAFLVKAEALPEDEMVEPEPTGFPGYDLPEIRNQIAAELGAIPLKPKTAQEALRNMAQWFDLVDQAIGIRPCESSQQVQNDLRRLADELDDEVGAPLNLLKSLVESEECWFDHHGGCQAHNYLSLEPGETCPQQELKDLIEAYKRSHK